MASREHKSQAKVIEMNLSFWVDLNFLFKCKLIQFLVLSSSFDSVIPTWQQQKMTFEFEVLQKKNKFVVNNFNNEINMEICRNEIGFWLQHKACESNSI